MDTKSKFIVGAISAVALVLLGVIIGGSFKGQSPTNTNQGSFAGAASGNRLIEDYIPVVRSNGGIKTNLGTTFAGANLLSGATTIGSSGTALTQVLVGTCDLIMPFSGTISASTTFPVDCAVSGVVSGDKVFVQSATTSLETFDDSPDYIVKGAKASSTSGYITVQFFHGGGDDTSYFTNKIGSSTQYLIVR